LDANDWEVYIKILLPLFKTVSQYCSRRGQWIITSGRSSDILCFSLNQAAENSWTYKFN